MTKFANIIIPRKLNELFTYTIPENQSSSISVGKRVLVEFGNRIVTGIIAEISDKSNLVKIKPIIKVLDEKPIVSKEMFRFLKWIADYYLCTLGEVITAALPSFLLREQKLKLKANLIPDNFPALEKIKIDSKKHKVYEFAKNSDNYLTLEHISKKLNLKISYKEIYELENLGLISIRYELDKEFKIKMTTAIKLNNKYSGNVEIDLKSSRKQEELYNFLSINSNKNNQSFSKNELIHSLGFSNSSINALIKKKLVIKEDIEVSRIKKIKNTLNSKNELLLELTEEQRNILSQIQSDIKFNNEERILLRGITGSGKTLIYMNIIEDVVTKGKMALYLLPEIALTPQLYDRFETAFPGKVCTIHSKLSKNERFELYLRILSGEFSIIIGARSAIFSPIKNVGLIIVDEEHDKSFKQESPAPRYNARDCSIILSKIYSCPVLLGSATPSLESYFNVIKKKFKLYELKNRFRSDITLPHIHLVDLIDAQRNSRIQNHMTLEINQEINSCLKKGRGVIIFLNRRGFANYLQCKECGFIPECPHCSVRLTYHEKINKLVCHYCSHSEGLHSVCNNCNGLEFDKIGTGIQKVEKDIVDSFLNYKIERFDSDSARKIETQRSILQNFKSGKTQILIGTQMLSKGIDIDNVGMVVIVNADLELFLNDFRASERTYQLLNQVAGRAGRGAGDRAKVFVQSSNTEHPAIKSLLDDDVKNYLKNELNNREELNYPPISRLIKIEISSKVLSKSFKSANALYDMIPKNLDFIDANPPVQPTISRVKQEHRFVILIKNFKVNDKNGEKCRKVLRGVLDYYYKSFPKLNPKVIVDVDANSLI